jgi:hypothetical protein
MATAELASAGVGLKNVLIGPDFSHHSDAAPDTVSNLHICIAVRLSLATYRQPFSEWRQNTRQT